MKRDQTIYTCDGCRHSQTYDLNQLPPGWYVVTTMQLNETPHGTPRNQHLCMKCFAGVDWILRFQGTTIPPKVITNPTPLRTNQSNPTSTPADDELHTDHQPTALAEADKETEPAAIDGIRVDMKTLKSAKHWLHPPRVEYYGPGDRPDYVEGTLRGNWPSLGRVQALPSETDEQYVTHVALISRSDGWLYRRHRLGRQQMTTALAGSGTPPY